MRVADAVYLPVFSGKRKAGSNRTSGCRRNSNGGRECVKFSTPPVNPNDGEGTCPHRHSGFTGRGRTLRPHYRSPVLGRNRKLKKVNLMWSFCEYGTIHLALLKITNNVNKLTGDFGINDKNIIYVPGSDRI